MTDDITVRLDWHESSYLLRALRHPRERGSKEILEEHAKAIGLARLRLANDAATKALANLEAGT